MAGLLLDPTIGNRPAHCQRSIMDNESRGTDDLSDAGHRSRPGPAARIPQTGLRAPPLHILLVHPHCLFSQGLAAFLAAQPDVESLDRVRDGQSAWRIIRTRRPHIALLDLVLDKRWESEILRRVHARGIDTRCFLFGTDTDAAAACAPRRADAAGLLSKESSFEELMDVLRGVAAHETPESPSVPSPAPAATAASPGAVPLSRREREVVSLIVVGETNKTIARALGISPATVHTYRRRLMTKLEVHSAAALVRYAARNGLVD